MIVKLENDRVTLDVQGGEKLSEVVREAGIHIDLRCSGKGTCGKCLVELISGSFKTDGMLIELKPGDPSQTVKSCATVVLDNDSEIFIPETSLIGSGGRIAEDFAGHECETFPSVKMAGTEKTVFSGGNWRNIASSAAVPLGLAVDVGTTTIAAALIDMRDGNIIATASEYNRQAVHGDNVAARISWSVEKDGNLAELQRAVIDKTINPLIGKLCRTSGFSHDCILNACIAGNTVMTHIFFGISPESIGVLPFTPVMNIYPDICAGALGLKINPEAPVAAVPSISGYIGGDITAGIFVSGLMRKHELSVLVDIGTNCETALFDGSGIYTCAAAAGPAFEGAGVNCGCRALAGAIDSVRISTDIKFTLTTIDNKPARGICGSGMIDFVASGFRCGLIDNFGRLDIEKLKSAGRYFAAEAAGIQSHACLLTKDIYVSESDIEQILKAKAAVYSGLKTLLGTRGYDFSDLKNIYLAGGFARYIDIDSAVGIGMLPEGAGIDIKKIGNSSLAGACCALKNYRSRKTFEEISAVPENIMLNTVPEFESNFIDALLLPNFNEAEFPQVLRMRSEA